MVDVLRPLRRVHRELDEPSLRDARVARPRGEGFDRILFARQTSHDEMAQRLLTRLSGARPGKTPREVGTAKSGQGARNGLESTSPAELERDLRCRRGSVAALRLDLDDPAPHFVDDL